DVFSYTIRDLAGLTSTAQVTVTIQGSNDTPIANSDTAIAVEAGGTLNGTAGTNPTGNVVTNDADVDSGDTKTVVGVVAGVAASAATGTGASVAGTYGSVVINASGAFTYTVDNSNTTVQALRNSSQTLSEIFTYSMRDTVGATSTAQLSITIQGSNDAPVAVADLNTAVEAGGLNNGTAGSNPTGNVLTNDTDVDAGDTKTVTGVAAGVVGSASTNVGSGVTGSYGSINIAANGAYTYTVDNSNAAVQALRTTANTLQDVFTYTMRDTAGLTSTTQVTVTIQGANDAPHDLAGTLTVAENSANGTSVGTITRSDVDSGDGATYSLVDNAGGRFAINSSTGVVTVANSSLLDRETAASHNITVRVTDTAGATYDEVFAVAITDVDEFDVGSVMDSNANGNSIAENSANGTAVGITASAIDFDATNNNVTYSL
ncbi:MAG: VCBS domain-containing protein, partial [Pirellula sp.]